MFTQPICGLRYKNYSPRAINGANRIILHSLVLTLNQRVTDSRISYRKSRSAYNNKRKKYCQVSYYVPGHIYLTWLMDMGTTV